MGESTEVEIDHGKIAHHLDRGLQYGHSGVKITHGYGASTGGSLIEAQAVRLMKSLAV